MADILSIAKNFLQDKDAFDMSVTGRAGTGKTTDIKPVIEYLLEQEIPVIVCAYTHQACNVLRSKIPAKADVATLHSVLGKRPTVNVNGTNMKYLTSSKQVGAVKTAAVWVIDEYSFIDEKDLADIRNAQDPLYTGVPEIKVIWLGDPYQLPPINGPVAFKPNGPYQVVLTEIKRQAKDNPLGAVLDQLVGFIEGETPTALLPNENFVRGQDLIDVYNSLNESERVILCYTNKRVEELNRLIQGRSLPIEGDKVFSPSLHETFTFVRFLKTPDSITLPLGDELHINSKYKTLEHLHKMMAVMFAEVKDANGNSINLAVSFGHYNYKCDLETFKSGAAMVNKEIEDGFKAQAAYWAKNNETHPLARRRSRAWRDFLSFNDCVVCLDFAHAMTVHKSQGSTFDNVLVDTDDLFICAKTNFTMYCKLMYVAFSRARKKVFTN